MLSKQEGYFKCDSPEGFLAAVHGVGRSLNYQPNYKRMKVETSYEGGDWPLDEDAFIEILNGKPNIPKQIILKGSNGRKYILREKFTGKKVAESIEDLKAESVEIVTYRFEESELKTIYAEVKAITGKDPSEQEDKIIPPGSLPKVTKTITHLIDRDLKRVVLKTVFNYFAYCALPHFQERVYGPEFRWLRNYALQPDSEYKGGEMVISRSPKPIIFNTVSLPENSKFHVIRIYRERLALASGYDDYIVGELHLFSSVSYKVYLAKDNISGPGIGQVECGHLVDIEKDQWTRIDMKNTACPPDDFSVVRTKNRIAILGWGSLLWDNDEENKQFTSTHDDWRITGPKLKLEFSRISKKRDRALTLVIDPSNGSKSTVAWCLSNKQSAAEAQEDLRKREETTISKIGLIALASADASEAEHCKVIRAWALKKNLTHVVWTDLPSNFKKITGRRFTVKDAVRHIYLLSPNGKRKAAEYIKFAPSFVNTQLRRWIRSHRKQVEKHLKTTFRLNAPLCKKQAGFLYF